MKECIFTINKPNQPLTPGHVRVTVNFPPDFLNQLTQEQQEQFATVEVDILQETWDQIRANLQKFSLSAKYPAGEGPQLQSKDILPASWRAQIFKEEGKEEPE